MIKFFFYTKQILQLHYINYEQLWGILVTAHSIVTIALRGGHSKHAKRLLSLSTQADLNQACCVGYYSSQKAPCQARILNSSSPPFHTRVLIFHLTYTLYPVHSYLANQLL